MYKTVNVEIKGIAPLLMHNGALVDPLNEHAQAIAEIARKGSRRTTLEDRARLADLEFLGGLYVDEQRHPCVPGEMLEAMLRDGAKNERKGKQATAGIICDGNFALLYDGPRTPEELVKDKRYRLTRPARVGTARVTRTRPRFAEWRLAFTIHYLPDVIGVQSVRRALETAGMIGGLGDWRPKYGRFTVEKFAAE